MGLHADSSPIGFAADTLVTRWAQEFFSPEIVRARRKYGVTFSAETNPISLEKVWDLRCVPDWRIRGDQLLGVIRELSNYIDKDVTPQLREQIVEHLPGCSLCTAIYDGLRNTITLSGDGRAFDLPAGFSQRLRAKLAKQ